MGKLMKYEFRKQLFSKAVILMITAIFELYFLYAFIIDNPAKMGNTAGFYVVFAFVAVIFVSFEGILTFSNDLRTKTSYMIFLTPNTSYSIVGAKIVSAVIQIGATAAILGGILGINAVMVYARYDSLHELLAIVEDMLSIDIEASLVILVTVSALLSWITIVILAYFSITLSSTFLANKRGKGFVSFIIFLVIDYLVNKGSSLILDNFSLVSKSYYIINDVILVVCAIALFFGTSYMLEKKVSV